LDSTRVGGPGRGSIGRCSIVCTGKASSPTRWEIEFVPCSEVFMGAFETFRTERSSALSFGDAAIATVARRHPPGFVATFDDDFSVLDGVTVVP